MLNEIGFKRGRLRAALTKAASHHLTLLCAPYGYGKTSVLLDYAEGTEAAYLAVEDDCGLLGFAGAISDAIASRAEGIERTLTAAHARALQMPDPPAALAAWFVRHLRDEPFTILIDDLHAARSEAVTSFLIHAIDLSPASCKWIVASESLDDLPVARWLAHGAAAYPLLAETLCLTMREALASAMFLAPNLSAAEVARLHARCGGIPADFSYHAAARSVSAETPETSVPDIAAAFAGLSEPEQRAVMMTCLLPQLDDASVIVCGGVRMLQLLKSLRKTHRHLFEWHGQTYHSRLRTYAIGRLGESDLRRAAVQATAKTYEGAGKLARALRLLATICDEIEMLRVIERQGFTALDRDVAHHLRDAVRALSQDAQERSAAALTTLAVTAALERHSDVCESLFQNAMVACASSRERWFVRYRYAAELIRRGRGDEAISLLQAGDALETMSIPFRACIEAALAVASAVGGQTAAAQSHIESALALILEKPDPAAEARIRHQASYVALAGGDFERAKEFARHSARLAERCGLAEVEGGALTVLYNIFADIEEDAAAAVEVLRRIAECGGKAGSIELQFYGLVGAYELEAERGNDAALAALEDEVRDFEIQYGETIATQGLLPSQALQLACAGEFRRAWRILKPSAVEQLDPERRALRWSEISVFAACAGDRAAASHALAEVRRCARGCDSKSARMRRSATMHALSLTLLGKCRRARSIAAHILREVPQRQHRTRALAKAVDSLATWRMSQSGYEQLLEALSTLHAHDLGGIARLFESLPPASITPIGDHEVKEPAA